MTELLLLLILAGGVWFWINSLLSLESATKAGKQACTKAKAQFLDDTVSGIKLRVVRDENGVVYFNAPIDLSSLKPAIHDLKLT